MGNKYIEVYSQLRAKGNKEILNESPILTEDLRMQFMDTLANLRSFMILNNLNKELIIELFKRKTYPSLQQHLTSETGIGNLQT